MIHVSVPSSPVPVAVAAFLILPVVVSAQVTDVCGDVSGFWAAGVYRSTCDLRVPDGQTLTFTGGVILKLDIGHELVVEGTLDVNGSPGNEVFVTSLKDDTVGGDTNGDGGATTPAAGDWKGIFLDGAGDFDGVGTFDSATVRYGGGAGGSAGANIFWSGFASGTFNDSASDHSAGDGLRVDNPSPGIVWITESTVNSSAGIGIAFHDTRASIQNSSVTQSGGIGLEVIDGDVDLIGSTFSDNGGHGVHVALDTAVTTDFARVTNCSFDGNAGWGALIEGGRFGVSGSAGSLYNVGGSGNTLNGIALEGADVTVNSVWATTDPGFPIVLLDDLTVIDDVSLTLSVNTVVKAADGVEIAVRGTLAVSAAPASEVIFTSIKDDVFGGDTNGDGGATTPEAGDWEGIFLDGSGDFDGVGNFNYSILRFGGGATGSAGANVAFSDSTSGSFQNSTSSFSAGDGLRATTSNIFLLGSRFEDNTGYAVILEEMVLHPLPGVTAARNGINAIGMSGTVAAINHVWPPSPDAGFFYVFLGPVTVPEGMLLTLNPGLVIKCAPASEFVVHGNLSVVGSVALPVVFTSIADDSVGGDTNGDGSSTSPAAGDWDGVLIDGTGDFDGSAQMAGTIIRYGGNPAGEALANLRFVNSGPSSFDHGRSHSSAGVGVRIDDSSPSFYRSMFYDNDSYGLYIFGSSAPDLGHAGVAESGWNYASGNDAGIIQIYNDTGNTIHSSQGLWDYSSSSEIDDHIWDDDDDAALGEVVFEPWTPNPIFTDGLESGGLGGWSSWSP